MNNYDEQTTIRGVLPSPKVSSTIKETYYTTRRGIRFPFPATEPGYIAQSVEVELAKANLKQLLNTKPGESVMLPGFGCDLESLLFDPFDEELVMEAKDRVVDSITTYTPHLKLNKVQVSRSDQSSRFGIPTLLIKVFCQIRDDENTTFEVSVKV